MIKDEFDLADMENKDIIGTCPMVMKCLKGFPTCQVCVHNAWIKVLSENPTVQSAFDFDRPGGHLEARRKAGWWPLNKGGK